MGHTAHCAMSLGYESFTIICTSQTMICKLLGNRSQLWPDRMCPVQTVIYRISFPHPENLQFPLLSHSLLFYVFPLVSHSFVDYFPFSGVPEQFTYSRSRKEVNSRTFRLRRSSSATKLFPFVSSSWSHTCLLSYSPSHCLHTLH